MLVENGRPPAAKKRLVIKGLKQTPKLPDDFESGTWEKLQVAVLAVQQARAVGTSLEELYQAVENMCIHKHAGVLYQRLQSVCATHIQKILRDLQQHLVKDPKAFLQYMKTCWDDHCRQMLLIRSIFLYLDRSFVVPRADAHGTSIYDMGLQQFRSYYLDQKQVGPKVIAGVVSLLLSHRQNEATDTSLLQSMLRMLRDLGLYQPTFLTPFLQFTEQFYSQEGLDLVATLSVPSYLEHCEKRLTEERARCLQFLDPSTLQPLLAVVKEELLGKHFASVLAQGLGPLLEQERLPDLARLFRLAGVIGEASQLQDVFKKWVVATGVALVSDTDKDSTLVDNLLHLKALVDKVVHGPFEQSQIFQKAVREALEKFINTRDNKPAELIAKYLDNKLRTGHKAAATDAELESQLESALVLFRYIQGKDVFEAFYKKDFAKRLLMSKSASVDVEKSMLARLKAECGAQYTSKLEGMFKDEHVSKDIARAFKSCEDAQAKMPKGLDANVHVLTSGFWPTYPVLQAKLPDEVNRAQKVFEDHYLSKYSGRRLVWFSCLENCTLRARFKAAPKDLIVSMHQAMVLLLFNDRDEISFADISEACGLPDAELRRTLQSLSLGKVRVIKKTPQSKDVKDEDVFKYVPDFTHKLTRIKINQIQVTETFEENKRTNDQVLQDRQHQIDAAIVRTMKSRKQLSHKLLIGEVMQQLRFTIRAADLKKRIEGLIERDYMARDPDNYELYNYLA